MHSTIFADCSSLAEPNVTNPNILGICLSSHAAYPSPHPSGQNSLKKEMQKSFIKKYIISMLSF